MQLITHNEIEALNISNETVFSWVEEMICNKDAAILPPKISIKPQEGVFCNVMPSFIGDVGGIKVVTRYPGRTPSLDSKILLLDANNGEFLTLMDGNWITAMRTGAVAAHSIKLFAKRDFSNIGIIGLGNTARATLSILLSLYPERQFTIHLYEYKDQHLDFANRFKDAKNITFVYAKTCEEILRQVHVLLSCVTYFPNDICANECYPEGILIVPIHTLGFTNCDLFFDKIYADDVGHVKHFKNFNRFPYFAETHDVVIGTDKGRTSDKERILAYNIGIAMHDVYFAANIYKLLQGKSEKVIDMPPPSEKFWI